MYFLYFKASEDWEDEGCYVRLIDNDMDHIDEVATMEVEVL